MALRRTCALIVIATTVWAEQPPIDPRADRAPALVEIAGVDASVRIDLRYATRDNFTGRVLYRRARALLQQPAAEALARVHRALAADDLGLVVLDAYRPWAVTKALWDTTPPAQRGFVADPARGSRHNRGAAVDVTLFDRRTGALVPMPSAYDDFSERAAPTYAGGTEAERANRDRLRDAMEREGFFVHPAEWWHFDYKDWAAYPILDVAFDPAPPPKTPALAPIDLRHARIVDLTHTFDTHTLYWPSSPSGFALERLAWGTTPGGFFYAANAFCAPEHGGTHLDAPIHFADARWTTESIPVEQLLGPAVVLDVTEAAARNPDYRVSLSDLSAFEQRHGRIPDGSFVVMRSGWDARWPDRRRVFGDDTPGRTTALHFPGFVTEAARVLVDERHVKALAVDTPSIDYGPSTDFAVHRIAAAANVLGLENVAGAGALPPTGAWIIALPMKIGGGSGGPVRIVGVVPNGGAIP